VEEIQVSNGLARVGSHVQFDANSYEWDKSKPIGPGNYPTPTGPIIRSCGRIIEIWEGGNTGKGPPMALVEGGMDRHLKLPKDLALADEHADGSPYVPGRDDGYQEKKILA